MELHSLGYVGQNLSLGLTTGRTLRLKNLEPERVAQVAAANLDDLQRILEWNVRHGIRLFRVGSSVIPFASHPRFDFDWQRQLGSRLRTIRDYVHANSLRLSMHPGQYTVLNSTREEVVSNALAELEYHAAFLARVAPGNGTMTLHAGGAYGDRERALDAFASNLERLSPQARHRLTIENDDTTFGIDDVLSLSERTALPVVFDFFHHRVLAGEGAWQEKLPQILEAVVRTWPQGSRPKFHLSSARESGKTAHADYIAAEDLAFALGTLNSVSAHESGDDRYDLMLEAKAKDRAVLAAKQAAARMALY